MKRIVLLIAVLIIANCNLIVQHLINLSDVEKNNSSLKSNIVVDSQSFSDELMDITWEKTNESFQFKLKNKSGKTMKLIWDDVVYINETGRNMKVIHSGIKYINKNDPMSPSTIINNSNLIDVVIPSEHISFSGRSWTTRPLFSSSASVGKTVKVFFPIEIDNKREEYIFSFDVTQQEN
ncbi:MAG: hypothetical protein KBA26_12530 [Candidatus Delongbacteria bacterium]|nr:hypothetical protein [Candidatus Delongbacteria bacterium]